MIVIIDADDFLNEHEEDGKIVYVFDEDSMTIEAHFFENREGLTNEQILSITDENLVELYELFDEGLFQQEKIGHISIDSGWLEDVQVEEVFRRRGVGQRLIELAIQHAFMAFVAAVQVNTQYPRGLTTMGEHLIAACIARNVIPSWSCSLSAQSLISNGRLDHDDRSAPLRPCAIVAAAIVQRNAEIDDSSDEDETDDEVLASVVPSAPPALPARAVTSRALLPPPMVSDDEDDLRVNPTNTRRRLN